MMIMPAAQISDSPLIQPCLLCCFDSPLHLLSTLWNTVEYVLLTALDYKQQTTFQNISQGHGQMKLPNIAEKGVKVMEP